MTAERETAENEAVKGETAENEATIVPLPPAVELQTVAVLAALTPASRALAELKGRATALPNPSILLDTLFLQEALASSEIENIVTTQDDAFHATVFGDSVSVEAKEVVRYRDALLLGYRQLRERGGISANMLIDMFRLLKQADDGFRAVAGAVLWNEVTGKVQYKPPQNPDDIVRYMNELERFINDDSVSSLDPLIKMALIHHQFESIHPFRDGNGRIGRMLNILYLTRVGLLDFPILYLSRAINRTKGDYYRLLQAVRTEGRWEEWVIYMLNAVTEMARFSLRLVGGICDLMADYKGRLRDELPKLYSQELLNHLFHHPYTRAVYVAADLEVGPQTARKYLQQLADAGLVAQIRVGRNTYYINEPLVKLFVHGAADTDRAANTDRAADPNR